MNRLIERPLAPPQSHNYDVDLVKGQYLQVTAASEQLLLSVEVALGKAYFLASDYGVKAPSNRIVSLIAPETASYRINVGANGKTPPGEYKLLVTTPQNPPPAFFMRAKAQRLKLELKVLYYDQRKKEAFLKMPEVGEEAARLFAQLDMPKQQADALNLVAEAWRQLGEWHKALDAFARTLQISRTIGYHHKEAEVLTFIGMCRYQVSDYRHAIEAYREALPLWKMADTREPVNMLGWTLTQLGYSYVALGESRLAIEAFEQAAQYYQRGYDDSERTASAAKEWHFGTAFCLRGIGRIHALAGEKQKAIDALSDALEHFKGAGDNYYEPLLLNDLGELYASLGESGQALDFYERALRAEQRMGSRAAESQTLQLIGALHQAAGADERAREYFEQALAIRRGLDDRRGLAATLTSLGAVYAARGEGRRALDAYAEALALWREIGDRYGEGFTLNYAGAAYASLGEQARALEHFNQSLALRRAVGDRQGEANTLYNLARLEMEAGRLNEARVLIEAALQLTEFIRSSVLSLELRASYLGTVRDYYELYVELRMWLHEREPEANHHAAALQTSERARARSLLESLVEAQSDIRAGAPAELLVHERELRQRLNAKLEYQLRLQTSPTGPHTAEQLAEVAREMQAITADYREAQARIRAASPRYAALTQPQPLGGAEIQGLLDGETLLLEYALGERRSFVWAVTRETITSYALPGRAEINRAARRVYELLIARNRFLAGESAAQRRARIAQADAQFPVAAAELSRMVLGPVAAQLSRRRLLIVTQEALQFIPFAVLPVPDGGWRMADGELNKAKRTSKQSSGKWVAVSPRHQLRHPPSAIRDLLIVEHEIVSLPSASALAQLRRENGKRQAAPKAVAVIADPVFSRDDARVLALSPPTVLPGATEVRRGNPLRRVLNDLNSLEVVGGGQDLRLQRLPGTRAEADQIAALVPSAARLRAVDFTASRALVVSEELNQYRIVHFATHALINTIHPELSGVVLSLIDEQGCPQDGFLPAHEIYNLKLSADLVVLSACQTGLGKEIRGEGLVGMTQSFLYAGAPRVVVSLWAQQDKATADLMSRFYQRLLNRKRFPQLLSPAAALRAAQLEMRGSGRWPAPYFWAGFVLQGEGR